jgi:GH25 family lysozyme M1 (1,4-beta-N-acetylmuramidase)
MCPQSPMRSTIVIEKLLDPIRMKRRRKLQPVAINPLVVDLSHHNEVADFDKIKAAGIAGIIHKATEAIGFVDNMYAVRRGPAMNAGLLWGAYHFLRSVSIQAQVDFFLKIAAPDNTTLLALDHEDERVLLINAKEFLLRVEDVVGRKAVLYSGFLIKEQLGDRMDAYLAAHRLARAVRPTPGDAAQLVERLAVAVYRGRRRSQTTQYSGYRRHRHRHQPL